MSETPNAAHVDVRYVANLARIALTDDETARYGAELDAILAYVAKLSELDVEGIEPTAHAMPLTNVLREDELRPSSDRERVLANAPRVAGGEQIRVPVVIEEEGA